MRIKDKIYQALSATQERFLLLFPRYKKVQEDLKRTRDNLETSETLKQLHISQEARAKAERDLAGQEATASQARIDDLEQVISNTSKAYDTEARAKDEALGEVHYWRSQEERIKNNLREAQIVSKRVRETLEACSDLALDMARGNLTTSQIERILQTRKVPWDFIDNKARAIEAQDELETTKLEYSQIASVALQRALQIQYENPNLLRKLPNQPAAIYVETEQGAKQIHSTKKFERYQKINDDELGNRLSDPKILKELERTGSYDEGLSHKENLRIKAYKIDGKIAGYSLSVTRVPKGQRGKLMRKINTERESILEATSNLLVPIFYSFERVSTQ